MVDRFERRDDVDGCACLACRGVSSLVTRRGLGGIMLWSIGVLRRRVSVAAVFLLIGGVQFVGYVGSIRLELALSVVVFVGAAFARSYAATVASAALADRRYTPATVFTYVIRRLPTVVGLLFGWFVVVFVLVLVGVFAALFGTFLFFAEQYVHAAIAAVVAVAAVVSFFVVAAKFVLAPEAAVVGGYGPVTSLRVSWGLISLRRRTTLLLLGLVLSMGTGLTVAELSTVTEPYPVIGDETTRMAVHGVSLAGTMLSSAVSSFTFAHVYVLRILE
ncbi:hypothetical protein [Halopiger goleimassiliensis]|uniref:hypothetical protein n=1 Tax=Halopiger goleimassiliensis TaxID=1293048 RepID=UPI000677C937|nr:hypothetical protein [Halopiger goleimassiliensis]